MQLLYRENEKRKEIFRKMSEKKNREDTLCEFAFKVRNKANHNNQW